MSRGEIKMEMTDIQSVGMNAEVANSEEKYESFWYAALVQAKCENIVAKQIAVISNDFEVWVATATEMCRSKQGGGKTRQTEVVLLPSYVFFRFPAGTKRSMKYAPLLEVKKLTKVYRLVQEPDHAYGEWEGAHIPDQQIEQLKFILRMSDTPVNVETKEVYVKGDKVRVVRGSLIGLEGIISKDDDGKDRIYVVIDKIGYASTEISRRDVEYVRRRPGRPKKTEEDKG